jgi:hypothetical protein
MASTRKAQKLYIASQMISSSTTAVTMKRYLHGKWTRRKMGLEMEDGLPRQLRSHPESIRLELETAHSAAMQMVSTQLGGQLPQNDKPRPAQWQRSGLAGTLNALNRLLLAVLVFNGS